MAAAVRNSSGNSSAIWLNPVMSSCRAALLGWSSQVVTAVAPSPRATCSMRGATSSRATPSASRTSTWFGARPVSSSAIGSGANRTPNSLGSDTSSCLLEASHRYSPEEAVPVTVTDCHAPSTRTSTPSVRSKAPSRWRSASTPAPSGRDPDWRATWSRAGSVGRPTTRPRSLSPPTRRGRSASTRVATRSTPSMPATWSAIAGVSPPVTHTSEIARSSKTCAYEPVRLR